MKYPIKVSMIWAQNPDGLIGVDNRLPWNSKTDMKFYAKTTTHQRVVPGTDGNPDYHLVNNIVIMGRKTYESLPPAAFVNRLAIVVTSKPKDEVQVVSDKPIAACVKSMHDAFTAAYFIAGQETGRNSGRGETIFSDIFIIGGHSIYKQALTTPGFVVHELIRSVVYTETPEIGKRVYFPFTEQELMLKEYSGMYSRTVTSGVEPRQADEPPVEFTHYVHNSLIESESHLVSRYVDRFLANVTQACSFIDWSKK